MVSLTVITLIANMIMSQNWLHLKNCLHFIQITYPKLVAFDELLAFCSDHLSSMLLFKTRYGSYCILGLSMDWIESESKPDLVFYAYKISGKKEEKVQFF